VAPMVRTCLLALLGLPASASLLAAEASFPNAAEWLAPNISAVTSCSEPMGARHYRTVIFNQGFEHVSSEVYLQWLEWNQEGPRLLKSVLVTELSSGLWSVGEPAVTSRENCSMVLAATHTYSLEPARFILRPSGPGKYSLRRVSKK